LAVSGELLPSVDCRVKRSPRYIAQLESPDLSTASDRAPFAVTVIDEADQRTGIVVDVVIELRGAHAVSPHSDKVKFVRALNGAQRAQMSE
jgi:hypothetical protein